MLSSPRCREALKRSTAFELGTITGIYVAEVASAVVGLTAGDLLHIDKIAGLVSKVGAEHLACVVMLREAGDL